MPIIAIVIFSISTLCYLILIGLFIKGWENIPAFQSIENANRQQAVTIICPYKNEEQYILALINSIKKQTYQNFECILIDDNSTDNGFEYVQAQISGYSNFNTRKNNGKGKKEALKTGIEHSRNELIVTIDADCTPNSQWLKTIVDFYSQKESDLIICPVQIKADKSLFSNFQQIEFVSLVASGAGASGMNRPILCNGANLAFKKSEWIRSEDELYFEEASGDDIYLLQSIKKRGGKIDFLKNKNSLVSTEPKQHIKDFIKQHIRWASKLSALSDRDYAITAWIVFLVNLIIVSGCFLSIFNNHFIFLLTITFFSKYIIDTAFFLRIKDFFNLKNVISQSFLFSFVYPFYIVSSGLLALISTTKKKKGF